MRLRGGGGAPATSVALLAAALLALVGTARAKPNFLAKGQKSEEQPIVLTQTLSPVEEEECPNNVLDNWLDEQVPWYTFVNMDLDGEDDPFPEVQHQHLGEDDLPGQHVEEQEEEKEVEEKETSEDEEDAITSPVSLEVLGRSEDGLLNPGKDYEVFVLSDIANTAKILVVLDNYMQMSSCGVGGFRKIEGSEELAPHYSLSPDYLRIGESPDYKDDPSYMPPEGGMNSSINVGECFWWAKGILVGGDEVSLEYTPPECGCVMLSVYAAFETKDATMISGPDPRTGSQSELLCVARSTHKEDEDEGEDEVHLVQLQDDSPRPQVILQDTTDVVTQSNDLTDDDDDVDDNDEAEVVATPQPTESKEKRRKKWRQRIRKNKRKRGRCTKRNWWKCRKNTAARLQKNKDDLEENEVGSEGSEESPTQPDKKNHGKVWKRRRQHKRKKASRKNHRHHKKARKANPNKCTRWRRRRGLCKVTEVPEVQDVDVDTNNNETKSSQELGAELRNQDQAEDVNEDLFALLLGPEGDTETILEHEEQEVSEAQEGEEERGREGRRLNSKKPLMNQRKVRRMLPPGKKFCCKQGIMMKKTTAPTVANSTSPIEEHLLMTPAPEGQEEMQEEEEEDEGSEEEDDNVCLESPQEVTTWAHYKLKIDPLECDTVYKTCCSKFNVGWWLAQRQRKQERKERRKEIFQQRWKKMNEKRKQKKSERKAKIAAKKNKWEAKKAKWNARKNKEGHEVVE